MDTRDEAARASKSGFISNGRTLDQVKAKISELLDGIKEKGATL